MIPPFSDLGNLPPWPVLPPGIHWATMGEIEQRFAINGHRRRIFIGFHRAITALAAAQCTTAFLNGSFVTAKPFPEDFDGCWDPSGVDRTKLDPVLLDFANRRAAQKAKYLGEMFVSTSPAAPGTLFLDFFQQEKTTGKPKGIIGLLLK